ncbi:YigZ family protein [Microbacter margulisiae]|uniref:Putative YigZ family protein n=1 Tax=Microbacter margulisiae TaxID=1350067 RepID=A0A7W5DSM1_9PORP|nr:YigZ family protein [Microbacter margulisiae]MBB3188335.1 putative YigZ family protein [Microbacter margulisiae]
MSDCIRTLRRTSEGIYKEKGSKFLSFAMPVSSETEIRQIIESFRKRFYDARHVCYAYVLGEEKNQYRAYDDGEPSGTAGRPILGQIHSYELTNVLIIVVRYFGGVLLGTGGLTHAYKQSATDALANNEISEEEIRQTMQLSFDYAQMPQVMAAIKAWHVTIQEQQFESTCHMVISIPRTESAAFLAKLQSVIRDISLLKKQ